MPIVGKKQENIAVVKKIRDYSEEPAFKKKLDKAVSFLKKYGLPKSKNRNITIFF